ncbi:4-amino-4-deoxychorismate lyase [Methylorubrum extorquens]|uniref:Probable branched-chain-amino-acid aminotransferase n=1 Tax=Methylorubrum extorquens TaxID=408 RepID=A0AAX3WCP0_METEX|nr:MULTISPECIES: aminotransferase class IV [Methylobacteriaceae]KQO94069.1 class IV aminotransferase [Methylobacterium sp. Leaf92]KQQ23333.1 class IV aminotransferase [Methylobacterium sp. Leaf122]WHQ68993.1 aminotransferase class IV [Methylorubrum extorquens]GEL43279.1 4-amino-4-deoxychorismate lyase [Methylorubrum extorquens]
MLWSNGRLVEGGTLPFAMGDRGLLLGDGVFDTALAIQGQVAFEAAHVDRLAAAAEALGFAIARERIVEAMRALASTAPLAAIRTTLTRGPGPRGLAPPPEPNPFLFGSAAPARAALFFAPLRLALTQIARNETSPAARLKTLGYLDAVLAIRTAQVQGFDEALFLNTRGRVACAGTGNVFAVLGGTLVTPPLEDGVLPGIVRAELVARIAPTLGIAVEERPLLPSELAAAEALFVTNSLRLLAPVTALGAQPYDSAGHGAVRSLYAALRETVAAECGVEVDALDP